MKLADGTFKQYRVPSDNSTRSWQVADSILEATIRDVGENQWELTVRVKEAALQTVWFPWKPDRFILDGRFDNAIVYYPFYLGVAEKAASVGEWAWRGAEYPGACFAPLLVVADDHHAKIIAATNWPPRRVSPLYSLQRLTLRYDEPIRPGEHQSYRALIANVSDLGPAADEPWRLALDQYKRWLTTHLNAEELTPVSYPEWMRNIHGWLSVHLQNQPEFNPTDVLKLWQQWKGQFPWIQFWGQMSNYAGPRRLAIPPLTPEEKTGCCVDRTEVHPRYLPVLPELVKTITREGHVGYYARPRSPYGGLDDPTQIKGETNLAFLLNWLQKNEREYGANAFYIDVLGHHYFGDPLTIAHLLKTTISPNTVIEYPLDIYPAAFLVSGSLTGGDWHGGPERTPEHFGHELTRTTFPRFGRYLLDDRILFLGGSNSDWQLWGPAHEYWTERQAFLLGAKLDVINPSEPTSKTRVNQAIGLIIAVRDQFHWWSRSPRYLDRKGVSHVPADVDVRRFRGQDGEELLVIDNWDRRRGQHCVFEKRYIPIPEDRLSILLLGWLPERTTTPSLSE